LKRLESEDFRVREGFRLRSCNPINALTKHAMARPLRMEFLGLFIIGNNGAGL